MKITYSERYLNGSGTGSFGCNAVLPLCTKVHVCVEEALNVELNICPAGGRLTAHIVVGVERVNNNSVYERYLYCY